MVTLDCVARAVGLHRAGKLAEAEALYRAVLKNQPAQPDALHFLGLMEQQRGHPAEAIRLMRMATEAAPDYGDAFNNLGNVLKIIGELDEAEACYRKVLALNPRDANALSNLGGVLRVKGDLDAAEELCRAAIESEKNHVQAYNNLGNVLRNKGRHEEAIACYRASIAFDPQHPDGPKLLGLALCVCGKIDEAEQVYSQWLARDPGNPVAAHMLAACAGEGVPARASDAYVKGLFDGLAQEFDHHLAGLDYRAPELLAEAIVRQLAAAGALRVLDAGCGTGLCAKFLRAHAATLIGVDLSPRMLQRAERLALYDELVEAELTAYLRSRFALYDMVISADTLCYFGALDEVLAAAAGALQRAGWLFFTVEHAAGEVPREGYRLALHGRYCHSDQYVRDALQRAGFRIARLDQAILRKEGGDPVTGLVVSAQLD